MIKISCPKHDQYFVGNYIPDFIVGCRSHLGDRCSCCQDPLFNLISSHNPPINILYICHISNMVSFVDFTHSCRMFFSEEYFFFHIPLYSIQEYNPVLIDINILLYDISVLGKEIHKVCLMIFAQDLSSIKKPLSIYTYKCCPDFRHLSELSEVLQSART